MNSTISGSGSQSHLSTTQHRLRATNANAKTIYFDEPLVSDHTTKFTTAWRLLFPVQDARACKTLGLKWAALVYCCLSFVFMSAALYNFARLGDTFQIHALPEFAMSALDFLSSDQHALEPYILSPASPAAHGAITACIWSTDSDENLDSLLPWAAHWPGPISILVTTTTRPMSTSHQRLMQRLKTLKNLPDLSLHLLHTANTQHSPAAYLNMARLFAPSPTVMLFPASLVNILPADLYGSLTSRIPGPLHQPLLVTSKPTSAFTIPALTPLVLPRNYRVWCTERSSFLASRTSDWDDCLWQLWLEGIRPRPPQPHRRPRQRRYTRRRDQDTKPPERKIPAQRCATTPLKRLLDVPRTSKSGKRRLQWVKAFCRQVLSFAPPMRPLESTPQTENAAKK
ncbi:hypothetical protein C8J57DRAFT_1495873 [Mycena rebaudengoi]|nr:hypothetical protein C8J57DRAFT_1495873 [Mycena rebaudengoi]